MIDDVLKRRLNFCTTLPTLPAAAVKIIELANDPDADIGAVCQYISLDPVLSAKLLRTANTPLYKSAGSQQISGKLSAYWVRTPFL